MVCEWGMSDKMGPMTFGKKQEEIFLGREIAQHRDYSERTAQMIDEEVRIIIEKAMQISENLLKQNLDKLHRLANTLLEKEILDGYEIDEILKKVDEERQRNEKQKKDSKLTVTDSVLIQKTDSDDNEKPVQKRKRKKLENKV